MATQRMHVGLAEAALIDLPASVVQQGVLHCVLVTSFADAARLATTCSSLRASVYAALQHVEQVSMHQLGLKDQDSDAARGGALLWLRRRCSRLRVLHLDTFCTDAHLAMLFQDIGPPLPCLQEVHAVGSQLSDAGLCALLVSPLLPSLRLVDATSCLAVTHVSVSFAAKHSALLLPGWSTPRPKVEVHRLPAWFCQRWVCLSHRYITRLETHQYFPDGTFQFSRVHQAAGSVISFVKASPDAHHWELTVQFDDEDHAAAVGMPEYRPCVAIQLHPPDEPHIPDAPYQGCQRMRTAQRTNTLACPAIVPFVDPPITERDVVCGTWVAAP